MTAERSRAVFTPGADAGSCTSLTYANFGQQFFNTYCNTCHTSRSPRMTTQSVIKSNLSAIKSDISRGTMPPGGGLPSADKTKVLEWLNCSAP